MPSKLRVLTRYACYLIAENGEGLADGAGIHIGWVRVAFFHCALLLVLNLL